MTSVSSAERETTIAIPPYRYGPSWVIGATTLAVDHFVPDVERILLPEAEHHGGTVEFRLLARGESPPPRKLTSRKRRWLNRLRPPPLLDLGDAVFFDARMDDYFNWSHQVNYYLTLALAARSWVEEDVTVIVPAGTPGVAFDVYRMFDFEVRETDGPVIGRNCAWQVSHREVVPSGRRILVKDEYDLPRFDFPERIFLARRGARSIINEAEVEAILPGYAKIYTEDLSAAEQFALFRNATDIVAIHGAGLAPLQYRPSGSPQLRLVELTPATLMTRWFGIMCQQVGAKFIQVRGRLRPEYVEHFYGKPPYIAHVMDDFEVDPRSLEVALEMIA